MIKYVINQNTTHFKCVDDISELDIHSFTVNNSHLITLFIPEKNISKLNINQFNYLHELKYIDIPDNQLTSIDRLLFKNNNNLIQINFSNNFLKYFNLILDTFHYLTHLSLYGNMLSTLPKINYALYLNNNSETYENKYRYIDIGNNQFNCNCSMNWVNNLSNLITIELGSNLTYCSKHIGGSYISLRCYSGMQSSTCPVSTLLNC